MKKENADIILIEKYLEGQLSKKEIKEFEERLKEDRYFRVLVHDIKKLVKGIEFSARQELLNKLKKTEKSLPAIPEGRTPRVIKLRRLKYAVAVAATIALLAGSIYTIIISRDQSLKEDYFMEYYAPYPNIIHPVQRAEETPMTDEELAYYYYESEQYEKALELFLKLNEATGDSESTLFYLANIYMAIGNYEEAIENFTILLNDSVVFKNQTRWYLGLCYLEDGNYPNAQEQLEKITETKNSYNERAEELLSKIKNQ